MTETFHETAGTAQGSGLRRRFWTFHISTLLMILFITGIGLGMGFHEPNGVKLLIAGVVIVLFIIIYKTRLISFRYRFFCEHCEKYIPDDVKWLCGYCDRPNKGIGRNSVFRCGDQHSKQGCGKLASGYICHHCGKANWLESKVTQRDEEHLARNVDWVPPLVKPTEDVPREPTKQDLHAEKIAEIRRQKEEIEERLKVKRLQIDENDVDKKLRPAPAPPTPKSQAEKIFEWHREVMERKISERQAEIQMRELAKSQFPNDPAAEQELYDAYKHELRRMKV